MKTGSSQRVWILLGCLFLLLVKAEGRELTGVMDNQTIVIQTELVEDGEYVQAFRLIPYFSDRWRYDSLSGTVIFTRKDGVTVGIKAGDSRIVIGQKIFHTSTPLLRREGRLYIPLYVVDTYLFPGIQFGEAGQTVSEPEPTVTPTPALIATPPTGNIFVYPTPTPEGGAETPEPTVPVYIFGTPTPTVPPMAAAYPTVPSGVIVLDPGNDPAHPGPAGIAGQRECDLTLAICQKLAANLSQYKNFAVVLTRNGESDAGLTVQERITIANQSGGDLFLSLHCGGMMPGTRAASRGVVYFMNEAMDKRPPSVPWTASTMQDLVLWHDAYKSHVTESLEFAKRVNQELTRFFSTAGVVQMDSNPRPGRLASLRGLTMPGILVELGNLSNQQTAKYLGRDMIQQEIADGLELQISNFFYERLSAETPGGTN